MTHHRFDVPMNQSPTEPLRDIAWTVALLRKADVDARAGAMPARDA
jgi:hypothetical protein